MSGTPGTIDIDAMSEAQLRCPAERLRPFLDNAAPVMLDSSTAAQRLRSHRKTLQRLARVNRVVGAQRVGGLALRSGIARDRACDPRSAPAPPPRPLAGAGHSLADAIRGRAAL
jgi:hypothetical protein